MYQNRVHLIGYLGKNPEAKSAKQSGRKYTVFSLATKRAWKGADEEWHSKTEWHRVIAWNGLGEYAAAKLRKGDHIYIEGTLVSNIYEKKTNKGKNATSVQITFWQVKAQSIRKLDRVKSAQAAEALPPDAEAGDVPY
jgi:single-strand DNA-binding protein